ncbi:hypothetical protein FIBSPDRAFT_888673 [Athelia psychrophila]|uniref:Uncharacterized protein n=1 Tax=Athelia psychrophila TaxID=1759441 RepID=A0A166N1F3_9AGAM|nr:hypothetical protein FIBSPDRAFT_888673 [Fibularhizoctonia sp. CBS 109695]
MADSQKQTVHVPHLSGSTQPSPAIILTYPDSRFPQIPAHPATRPEEADAHQRPHDIRRLPPPVVRRPRRDRGREPARHRAAGPRQDRLRERALHVLGQRDHEPTETHAPVQLKWKAVRLRTSTENERFFASLDVKGINLLRGVVVTCYKPFPHLRETRVRQGADRDDVPGMGLGIVGAICCAVLKPDKDISYSDRKHSSLTAACRRRRVGEVLVPIGLLALAFKTYAPVPWIASISPVPRLHLRIYGLRRRLPPHGRQLRSMFAGAMYGRLGTVGATALFAGLTAVMAPLLSEAQGGVAVRGGVVVATCIRWKGEMQSVKSAALTYHLSTLAPMIYIIPAQQFSCAQVYDMVNDSDALMDAVANKT